MNMCLQTKSDQRATPRTILRYLGDHFSANDFIVNESDVFTAYQNYCVNTSSKKTKFVPDIVAKYLNTVATSPETFFDTVPPVSLIQQPVVTSETQFKKQEEMSRVEYIENNDPFFEDIGPLPKYSTDCARDQETRMVVANDSSVKYFAYHPIDETPSEKVESVKPSESNGSDVVPRSVNRLCSYFSDRVSPVSKAGSVATTPTNSQSVKNYKISRREMSKEDERDTELSQSKSKSQSNKDNKSVTNLRKNNLFIDYNLFNQNESIDGIRSRINTLSSNFKDLRYVNSYYNDSESSNETSEEGNVKLQPKSPKMRPGLIVNIRNRSQSSIINKSYFVNSH